VTTVINTKDFRNIEDQILKKSAITIGNFDGCHLGHQELIKETLNISKENNLCSVVITFDPHPATAMETANKELLTPLSQKILLLKKFAIDFIIVQNFSEKFKSISATDFYQGLQSSLKMQALVLGDDFRFGYKRQGDSTWLKEKSKQDQFTIKILSDKKLDTILVKSSTIRKLLKEEGDVSRANKLLDRAYSISSKAIKGRGLGKKLGFATINLGESDNLIPKNGVYCGYSQISLSKNNVQSTRYKSVFNIGTRPTVNDQQKVSVEGHLLDYPKTLKTRADNLYITFYLVARIRNEIKFDNTEDLKLQISNDCATAKNLLNF
jgi:riboflavin kinase / FMN adenylyltransferase